MPGSIVLFRLSSLCQSSPARASSGRAATAVRPSRSLHSRVRNRARSRLRNENFPINRSPTQGWVGLLRSPEARRSLHLQSAVLHNDVHAQCDCFRRGNAGPAGRNSEREAAYGRASWTTTGAHAPTSAAGPTERATAIRQNAAREISIASASRMEAEFRLEQTSK
jgi:hypothetical protein